MTLNVLYEGSGHWTSFTEAEDSGKRTESDLGLSHARTHAREVLKWSRNWLRVTLKPSASCLQTPTGVTDMT